MRDLQSIEDGWFEFNLSLPSPPDKLYSSSGITNYNVPIPTTGFPDEQLVQYNLKNKVYTSSLSVPVGMLNALPDIGEDVKKVLFKKLMNRITVDVAAGGVPREHVVGLLSTKVFPFTESVQWVGSVVVSFYKEKPIV